jgi:NADP-reducing hydrogenase subunit HndB
MTRLDREGLERLRTELRKKLRLGAPGRRARVTVHLGTCGLASGAGKVLDAARSALAERDVTDVVLTTSGCAGLCCREPMATVELAGEPPVKYADLTERRMVEIVERHVLGGSVVSEYVLGTGEESRM